MTTLKPNGYSDPTENFLTEKWDYFVNQRKDDIKPEHKNNEEDFTFYFLDAYEHHRLHPGLIFLFGKTFCPEENIYKSCCVIIEEAEKIIHLQPREFILDSNNTDVRVKILDVIDEFTRYATKKNLKNIKIAEVNKNSFIKGTPEFDTYLQVKFCGNLYDDKTIFKTIQNIFGLKTSGLETLLLSHGIKGPCWLKTRSVNKVPEKLSRCQVEIRVNDITLHDLKPPPPLVVAFVNFKIASEDVNEVALISCLINHDFCIENNKRNQGPLENFTVISSFNSEDVNIPNINLHVVDNEQELLNKFFSLINTHDPDLIIGNDLINHYFLFIAKKIEANSYTLPKLYKFYECELDKTITTGRLVCDLQITIREVLRLKNYDFSNLCKAVLKIPASDRFDPEPEKLKLVFKNDLKRLILSSNIDNYYIKEIVGKLNLIKFAVEITKIAGNLLSKTLEGIPIDRLEYFFLHTFNEASFLLPNKIWRPYNETFTGGLVLSPKVGWYSTYVILMDFTSLYPSIMLEYNVCLSCNNDVLRVLPLQIKKLIDKRRELKAIDKTMALALKFMANSIYGYLSYNKSRFYGLHLSALIAEKGREILKNTVELLSDYSVIYGDTDSIMIDTKVENYDEAIKITDEIKSRINQIYKYVEIDTEGVYKKMLLIQKRKYAAIKVFEDTSEEIELKGMEINKRDYCAITSEISGVILEEIFNSPNDFDVRDQKILLKLHELKANINKYPLSSFIINKQLSKNLIEYDCNDPPAFVEVAYRNNSESAKKFGLGDTISYLICLKNEESYPCLLKECESQGLEINFNYYLHHQVLNPIKSICQHVSLSLVDKLENILLNKTVVHTGTIKKYDIKEPPRFQQEFNKYQPFIFKCTSCKARNVITNPDLLLQCTRCSVKIQDNINGIKNQLITTIRRFIKKFIKQDFYCLPCSHKCKYPNKFNLTSLEPLCPECFTPGIKKDYNSMDFSCQLLKFRNLFDKTAVKERCRTEVVGECYDKLWDYVNEQITLFKLDVIDFSTMKFLSLPDRRAVLTRF